jgi:hypothetical protein
VQSPFPDGGERCKRCPDDRPGEGTAGCRTTGTRADWRAGLRCRFEDFETDVLALLAGNLGPNLGDKRRAGKVCEARRLLCVGIVNFNRNSEFSRRGDRA